MFTLHRDEIPVEHAAWAERTRAAMAEADLGPLDPSVAYRHRCPDFMAPIPSDPLADVEDEIERVRATDPALMAADIAECWPEGPPPPWDRFARSPREMADRLADALRAFWRIALADDWPRLRAVLEGEVLGRARSLATAGPAAVLDEIHPRMRWRAPVLELLLGHGRAAVLRALGRPATTTELAARLHYAPSTVSAHLDVLSRAGLVERHRVRRSVFYGLNATGSSLVALLTEIPETLSA